MPMHETFVDGLGNVAIQAALARIELTQLKSLPKDGQTPNFEVTSRLVMSIDTFLKMHQSFSEVIRQMEAKGLVRKAGTDAPAPALSAPQSTKVVTKAATKAKTAKRR